LVDWEPVFHAIEADSTIREILLSGGDPLMLGDARLSEFVNRLASIKHLRRLRIHSRLPIVLPNRICPPLIKLLTQTRLTPIVVVHANHPQEIVDDCEQALRDLVRAGVTTLNQTVLLKGINDDADVLTELSERLIDVGVIPYYLHQLDRVRGAAHFEVSEDVGIQLIESLRQRLPGYAVPRYVREMAGKEYKVPIA
jgi:KamA family protein